MLYCQSAPEDHRSDAIFALTFARACRHEYPARMLACLQHGAELRTASLVPAETGRPSDPVGGRATACERCGEVSALRLLRIEDVFEERVVVTILRTSLESSVHSPVTFAYDRANRMVSDRGLTPVTGYRMPVQWRSGQAARPLGGDLLEACVTVAVTVPGHARPKAG